MTANNISDDGNSPDTFDGGYSGKPAGVRTGGVHYNKSADKKQSIDLNYGSFDSVTGLTTTQTEVDFAISCSTIAAQNLSTTVSAKDATYQTKVDTSNQFKDRRRRYNKALMLITLSSREQNVMRC